MANTKNLKPVMLLFLLDKLYQKGERELENLRSMKLLFLAQKENLKPIEKGFEFIPYKFGPYSDDYFDTSMYLSEKGFIDVETDIGGEIKKIKLRPDNNDKIQALEQKYPDIDAGISDVVENYSRLNNDLLLLYTYAKYPDFTIKSEIKDRVLKIARNNFKFMQSKAREYNFSEEELGLVGI